ncbi:protein kinase [Actinoplanes sp. NPDC026619]|uniref:protein kinase domain-containing protein n=1 Tax=Actinoplanes sp. NPDC026619 TaxID=3155798 RepID=UPI0033E792C7
MTKDRTSSVARADSDGASTMDLSGRCVGSSYVLQHPIGQGATGTVWRGLDRSTGEPVAVKLLHESLLRQPKLVTRFVQERTILLMLRHRNVVRVRDLFSVGETLGLVMDLVDGGSLRDRLRAHGTVAPGEACRLAAQVAAALAEAHELGVIHRDLKPDNILLYVEDGRLDTRLTDFGVARILNTPSMTTPNAVVGTPHYMAPEAFHGSTASPATDVYALGVLLFELVSGRPPYDSDSIPDLMRRHMEGHPERRPGIPDVIWDLIEDCMAGKPRLRPSATEMVSVLSDAARDFAHVPALPRPVGEFTDPGSAYADNSAYYPDGLTGTNRGGVAASVYGRAARDHGRTGSVLDLSGAGRSGPGNRGDLTGPGRGMGGRMGAGPGGSADDDLEAEAVSLLPVMRKPAAREQVAREQVAREQLAREQMSREQVAREQVVREQVAREQMSREQVAREQAARGQMGREQVAREQMSREQVAREHAAQGQAGRGQVGEQVAREEVAREQGARARESGARGPGARGPGARRPERADVAPGWRWAKRPGVIMALIAAAMVASAVATTAWHYGRDRWQPWPDDTTQVLAAPTGSARPMVTSPPPRKAAHAVGPAEIEQSGSAAARSVTHRSVPSKDAAPRVTASRLPQPEAKPYGPWQCTQRFALDMSSRTPLAPAPCQMLGRDIQYQASLTAPGGGTGSITVSLQDAASGHTVAGPKTCAGLTFGGDAATQGCGPAGASPRRGRQYTVVMTYRYERNGRAIASSSKGSTFAW